MTGPTRALSSRARRPRRSSAGALRDRLHRPREVGLAHPRAARVSVATTIAASSVRGKHRAATATATSTIARRTPSSREAQGPLPPNFQNMVEMPGAEDDAAARRGVLVGALRRRRLARLKSTPPDQRPGLLATVAAVAQLLVEATQRMTVAEGCGSSADERSSWYQPWTIMSTRAGGGRRARCPVRYRRQGLRARPDSELKVQAGALVVGFGLRRRPLTPQPHPRSSSTDLLATRRLTPRCQPAFPLLLQLRVLTRRSSSV